MKWLQLQMVIERELDVRRDYTFVWLGEAVEVVLLSREHHKGGISVLENASLSIWSWRTLQWELHAGCHCHDRMLNKLLHFSTGLENGISQLRINLFKVYPLMFSFPRRLLLDTLSLVLLQILFVIISDQNLNRWMLVFSLRWFKTLHLLVVGLSFCLMSIRNLLLPLLELSFTQHWAFIVPFWSSLCLILLLLAGLQINSYSLLNFPKGTTIFRCLVWFRLLHRT